MGYINNDKIISEGLHVGSQTPIDDRLVVKDIPALIGLGVSDGLAYRYYEGMRVWVIDTREEYEWRESSIGALSTPFTYPLNISANGITYGGKVFNFVKVIVPAMVPINQTNITLLAGVDFSITVPTASVINDVSVLNSSSQIITHAVSIKVFSNIIDIQSNVLLTSVTVNITYTE